MTYTSLPEDLKRLISPSIAMSDKQWQRLADAWEANKRNKRKDALTPAQIKEIHWLLKKGTSVRETAKIVKVNRGRVWYIYKTMSNAPVLKAKGGPKKKKVAAEDFI